VIITLRRALADRLALFGLLFNLLLGLHATAVLLALGLHVVAALFLIFGSLILFSAHRLLLGLRGLHVRLTAVTAAIALHCSGRSATVLGGRRALLRRGTSGPRLAAGALRISEASSGDQRGCGN